MSLRLDLELFVHDDADRTIWGSTGLQMFRADDPTRMADRIAQAAGRLDLATFGRIPARRRRWTLRLAARRPCGACHRPLVFASTPNGSAMPLDPDPVATGNVYYADTTTVEVATGLLLEAARADGRLLFVSHFATCPQADRYRKKPAKRKPRR